MSNEKRGDWHVQTPDGLDDGNQPGEREGTSQVARQLEGAEQIAGVVLQPNEQASEPSRPGARTVWVDDLAGPEDYWLTLTDAARVTRRQEVTIRRWVAAGSLPVRSRALGLNKRTRHVRASDLGLLSPIVDASATISGATAQIDLLSIPIQQADLRSRQREIEENMQALAAQLTDSVSSQATRIEEDSRRLAEVGQRIEQVQKAIGARLKKADQQQASTASQLAQLQQELVQTTDQSRNLRDEVKLLEAELAGHAERQGEQLEQLRKHGADMERLEKELSQRIHKIEQRQATEAKDRKDQERRVEAAVTSLDLRITQVESTLAQEIKEYHAVLAAAERPIKELRTSMTRLHTETRRQVTTAVKQVHDLQDEVQATSRELRWVAEQRELIAQLTGQVRALSAAIAGTKQHTDEGKPEVRRGRRGRRSG